MTSRPAAGLPPGIEADEPRHGESPKHSPAASDPTSTPAPVDHQDRSETVDGGSMAPDVEASSSVAAVPAEGRNEMTSGKPLAGDPIAERHRLSPRVKRYWRWRAFFSALPVFVLLAGLAFVIPWGPWWVRWGIVGIAFLIGVLALIVLPPIRYQVFWYAISTTEIDIQHGIIFVKRSVVPMHRVQNLRTERGPMADHYRMTNLKIKTAAGSVSISGLDRDEADELCDRISRLADVSDDV